MIINFLSKIYYELREWNMFFIIFFLSQTSLWLLYTGLYISHFVRFTCECSAVLDFYERNLSFTTKLLSQGFRYLKKWTEIRRYQRDRPKSFSQKTNTAMANKMKRKTNIEHITLNWILKLEWHKPYKNQGEFRWTGKVKNSCS